MIIDNREKDLINLLNEKKISFNTENLELGDILYKSNNNDILLIERKTVDDLMASIKDGRHREQKLRLLKKQKEGCNIFYLIEGSILYNKNKDTLYSSILNTLMRDNIKIIFTGLIDETVSYLLKIETKLDFYKNNNYDNINNNSDIINNNCNHINNKYLDTIKTCKKDNITKEICFQAMLKQIPGVSSLCAESISKIYPSMNDILKKYNEFENEDDKKKLLSDIMINKRKIGKKLSEKIFLFLY
jgi:crossover junction endonuclease MUS81